MAFPNTVLSDLVSGVVGELAFDVPSTVVGITINSASAANNVFGRAFTYASETIETAGAGGTGLFAGLLINPKSSAVANLDSTADLLPNGAPGELMVEGEVYVLLSAGTAVTIGDPVFFVNADGTLGAGTAAAGQTQIAGATVVRHNPSAANAPALAVVRIKP